MRHNMRNIYSNLGAENNRSASAALQLLTQVINTSRAAAREFTQQFDFSLKSLPRLAKAKIYKGQSSAKPTDNGTMHSTWLRDRGTKPYLSCHQHFGGNSSSFVPPSSKRGMLV